MKLTTLSLVILAALCGVAAADVHTNKVAKLSIDAPGTYKLSEQDLQMKGESNDKAVALAFWLVDSGDPGHAELDVTGQFYAALGSIQWDKPTETKVNGLPAHRVDGTGRTAGKTVDLHLVVVGPTATKKYAILIGIDDKKQAAAHKTEISKILKRLRPAK